MKAQVFSLSQGMKEDRAVLSQEEDRRENKEWRGDSRERQERSLRMVPNLDRKEQARK